MAADFGFWLKLGLVAAAAWIIWEVCRTKWTTTIIVDGRGVRSHKGLAKAHQREIVDFLEQEASIDSKVVIRASRYQNGYVRLDIRGDLDFGTRQRIRNFLLSVL